MSDFTCPQCVSSVEGDQLRCHVCFSMLPQHKKEEAKVHTHMRCTNCGAAVSEFSIRDQNIKCCYCAAPLRQETTKDQWETTDHYLRFAVTRENAITAVQEWIKGLNWFYPKDLLRKSQLSEFHKVWWVGWSFDADALVSFTYDANEGAHKGNWAPYAGQVHMNFDDVVIPATRGLRLDECRALIPSYNVQMHMKEDEPKDGYCEEFDVPRSKAREFVQSALHRTAFYRIRNEYAAGSEQRNMHVTPMVRRLQTIRYSFPAYILAYRYRNRSYRAVISGHDQNVVVATAPLSVARVAIFSLACLVLLIFLANLMGR